MFGIWYSEEYDGQLIRASKINMIWNCPNCHRPQPLKRLILGSGLIRKEWRCGYCDALLNSYVIAKLVIGVLVGGSTAALLEWMVSDVVTLSPYVIVFVICLGAPLVLYLGRLVVVDAGHTICANCRYDLHGNTSGACPECGTQTARSSEFGGHTL